MGASTQILYSNIRDDDMVYSVTLTEEGTIERGGNREDETDGLRICADTDASF